MKDRSAKTDMRDDCYNAKVDRHLANVARWLHKRVRRGHPKSKFRHLFERNFMLKDARALVHILETGGETEIAVK